MGSTSKRCQSNATTTCGSPVSGLQARVKAELQRQGNASLPAFDPDAIARSFLEDQAALNSLFLELQ